MRPMIMDPDGIVAYKVSWIKRTIRESIKDQSFRSLVETKFHGVPKENIPGILWDWQKKFRFLEEPKGKDYVKHAMEFVRDGFGDCEDFVVFNAAILKMYGFPVRIRVTDTKGEGYYTHIMIQYKPSTFKDWITFDGTYRLAGCGGEPNFYLKWRHFSI